MSAIINVSLRVDKLPKEKFVSGKDGAELQEDEDRDRGEKTFRWDGARSGSGR